MSMTQWEATAGSSGQRTGWGGGVLTSLEGGGPENLSLSVHAGACGCSTSIPMSSRGHCACALVRGRTYTCRSSSRIPAPLTFDPKHCLTSPIPPPRNSSPCPSLSMYQLPFLSVKTPANPPATPENTPFPWTLLDSTICGGIYLD